MVQVKHASLEKRGPRWWSWKVRGLLQARYFLNKPYYIYKHMRPLDMALGMQKWTGNAFDKVGMEAGSWRPLNAEHSSEVSAPCFKGETCQHPWGGMGQLSPLFWNLYSSWIPISATKCLPALFNLQHFSLICPRVALPRDRPLRLFSSKTRGQLLRLSHRGLDMSLLYSSIPQQK